MNRIYKIIWSEVRKCYVVVSEIAKNHGKNNVKTVVSQLAARTLGAMRQLAAAIQSGGRRSLPVLAERPHTAAQWIVPLVLAGILLQAVPAYASKITDWPGGKTSLINTSDNVHDLYLQELVTPKNHTDKNFGVNRFTDYQVTDGDIVNMHFQSRNGALKTDSLVNLVQNRININGIVNGIKDGRIGGDLYFISPNGLAVGNKGVINTGKLFAFAPSSGYFDNLAWNHDSLASAFINDFQNFGTRDENGKLKDTGMKWNTDKDKGISIEGQINARSGIVLGAGHIAIKDGAVLKSSKDLDFTELVNVKDAEGKISVKNTTLDGADLTAVKDAKSGDIILRAEYEDHYKAKLYVPDEYIAAGRTTGTAEITVEGSVDGDRDVDISTSSTMTFTNRNWEGVDGIPQLGTEILSDLGINVAADVAVKHNTASVSVAETGSVKAGGKATLQADAVVSVNIQAQTANVKDAGTPGTEEISIPLETSETEVISEIPGTEETLGTPGTPGSSSALPVASVAVAKVNNKALVDIAGKVNSGQDMKLDALADTTEVTTSNAITKAKEGDTDSSVYFAGSFLYGNTLAEINVKAKSEDTITAGGQFTAEAEALSGVAAMAVAAGLDESVASTAVAVVDYNSAANVNLERSVKADSVKVKAENAVELMGVLADNHIGEGNKPVLDYHVKGETNPAVVTKKLQTFLNSKLDGSGWSVNGFRQGGVLSAMEGMFENALDYVTVGAAIGVLNNTNTANVTVAPGVKLEAKKPEETQDAKPGETTEAKPGETTDAKPGETTEAKPAESPDETPHDVILEAVTDLKAFSHQVTGEANKPKDEEGSKFTVAAAVLDSNIRNDAAVVLQSKDGTGVNLVADNGSVQLKADARIGDSTYFSPLSALEYQMASQLDESGHISLKPGEMGIEQVWDELISTFNKMGKDASKLKKWKKETVKIEKEAADGKITNNERATDKAKALAEFFTFLYNEGGDLRDATQEVKKLITTLTDYLSPASYTNYYVRTYTVDGQQSDKTNYDLAGSFNFSVLENKGVVAVGENSSVEADKDISISSDARSEAISATGNAGEYLAFSESTGTGIGASLAVHNTNTDSMIITGKNVTLTAGSGSIKLDSDAKADEVGIIYSAGEAQKNGVEASVSVQAGGASSLVLVDDETGMEAAGDVTLAANNSLKAVNVVGGLALGSSDATFTVGAGVAVNGLEANSMAVIGDNGTEEVEKNGKTIIQIANQEIEDPESKDNKDKTDEEKNAIKAKNTLAKARKLAADRAVVRSMGSDFKSAETKLTGYLGGKTEDGADKKTVTGQDVTVKANNSGSINSVAVESVNNAKQHKALDALNHYGLKLAEEGKTELTTTLMNAVSWPMDKFNRIFNGKGSTDHTWDFGNHKPITWQEGSSPEDSFNIAAAGSVAWNHNDHETAAVIDRMKVTLNYKTDGDGKLLNAATEDIFTGAWAGADAINWFSGTTSLDISGTTGGDTASRGSHKTGLGAAVAVNDLNRNVNALISNSAISQAGLLENTAVKNGAEAAGALGLAITNDSGSTTARDVNVIFGLSLNKNKGDVHALLLDDMTSYDKKDVKDNEGKTLYTYEGATDFSIGAYDGDIQVAGSVDLNVLKAGGGSGNTGGIAVGISASVSDLANDIRSGIQGGSYTGAGNIKVAGDEAFTQVNVAAGLDVDQAAKGFSGTGSLAYSDLANNTRSFIYGTDNIEASGEVSLTSRDISGNDKNPYKEYLKQLKKDPEGTSYLSDVEKDNAGKGAGSSIVTVAADVTEGTSVAAAAALSVASITNRFASDITGNKSLTAGSVKASSDVHTNIVSVASGVSVSEKSLGGVGSLSFNDLDQDNIVSITGNRDVYTDEETGKETEEGIKAGSVSGTAKNTSHIVNVTGDFAGGKNAVGLGIAYNRMDDTTGVYAANNWIEANDANKGVDLSLDADNDAYALALSIGAAATYKDGGKVAALGNFAVNRGHNDTVAVIGEDMDGKKDDKKDIIANASSVTVKAKDKTGKRAGAGAAELAVADTTVALGIGVALTESDKGSETGNGKETVRAEINHADITTVTKDDSVPVISAATTDTSKAKTAAVGVGVTTKSKIGAQGIGADANIYKTNTAGLTDTTIDKDSGSKEALVTVKAETASTLETGASALQLTGKESYLAGVVAVGVNRIKDTTSAGVTYTEKQDSASLNAGNLDISAASNGSITSVAVGVSGTWEGTAALGGSGSHNFIENNATAKIKNANISSTGNVGVVAQSDEAISNYAGLLDVNAGGQGVALAIGVTASTNQISGTTEAVIDNSTVVAKGSDDDSKVIKTNSKLKDNTKKDEYLIEGSVTDNTWKSGKLQTGREEEKKSGVVVDASATHAIASVMANGGVAVGVGEGSSGAVDVAGVVNLNTVSGETGAKILDSVINTITSRSDVTVHASDYTNVAEFSGVAAVGIGKTFGVTAGFTGTGNTVDRVTAAGVSTSKTEKDESTGAYVAPSKKDLNTVYAENFAVTADTKHAMSAFNVTGAVAASSEASVETGDNVNVNKMYSSTLATVTNTTVDFTKSAKVQADNEDRIYNLNIGAGVAGAADVAVSVNLGIGTVDADAAVTANVENSKLEASNQTTDKDAGLTVAAANKTVLETTLASAGIAGSLYSGSIIGSIAVNNISNRITSRVRNSTLTSDNISVNTSDEIQLKDATGEGAGALAIGIGAGVDVTTLNDSVSAIVDNSTLTAKKNLAVDTTTKRNLAATVAGAGVAAGTIQVNVLAVTVNSGIGNLNDNNGSTFNHQEKVKSVLETVNGEINDDVEKDEIRYLFKNVQGLTDDQKKDMKKKLEAGAKEGDKAGGVHTYVQNGSKLDAGGDLSIYNYEQNDADLNGGSGAFGLGDIIVSDVVVHLNQLNDIALTGSSVTGGSVSVMAVQGNEKDNKDDSIHARTVQVSDGIADIGVGYAGITTKGKTGVSVNNDSAITATDGVTLKSLDKARSKAEMLGISVAVANIPISLAHNTNTASNFVTVTGGSTLKPQDVTDSKGNKTGEKDLAYISLQSERSGKVTAKTTAVGAGGVEVAVNEAKARDAGAATVQVEGGGNQFKADRITLEANNHPQVKADAGSTDVALLGISVRHSSARAESKAYVTVEDGNTLLGDSVEAKAVIGKEGEVMADAKTHGTNVSVIAENPNSANAETKTEAKVNMGNETYKTVAKETQQAGETAVATEEGATGLSLISWNNASRHAVIDYTTCGIGLEFMPAGDGDAKPIGDDTSSVEAKGGTSDTSVKLASLEILAGGSNVARGLSDSSSGDAVSLTAKASADMTTKTKNTASLSGVWDVAGKAEIGSKQKVTAKGTSKSGVGSVLSAVWSHSHNQVEMDTQTKIAENAVLNAGESYVTAANTVDTGAYDNEHWNNHMDVGGLMQADEVKSKTDVKSANTVEIGKNAKVTTENGQVYEAHTDLDITNRVEGTNGGVSANQGVHSNNKVASANQITVDEGAVLKQDGAYKSGNDITLSSSDTITMDTKAEGYTGGVLGILVSKTTHDVTRNNSVTVKGALSSTHDVNLYAGANADGTASNLNINSLSNSHNRTFLTWPAEPEIKLDLKNNQQVQVESDGKVASVRNINVTANSGLETVRKDLRMVAILEMPEQDGYATLTNQSPGVSKIEEKNDNFVKVDGQLQTGVQNNVKIDITGALLPVVTTEDGTVHTLSSVAELPEFNIKITNDSDSDTNTDVIIKKEDIKTGSVNYATQLKAQYDALTELIKSYGADSGTAACWGYMQQRQRILDEMEKRGLLAEGTDDQGQTVKVIANEIPVGYVEIPSFGVSGGSIVVQSDTLYGKGKLETNGSPRIDINNLSNACLVLDGLEVGENGGEIRFQKNSIAAGDSGKARIKELNTNKQSKVEFAALQSEDPSASVSRISVLNDNGNIGTSIEVKDQSGKTASYTAIPDVVVRGDITDDYGEVRIENRQGSIVVGSLNGEKSANVSARTVQMIAVQGSISQDYTAGVVNVGGNPEDLNRSTSEDVINKYYYLSGNDERVVKDIAVKGTDAAAGRIAGDSVYLSADSINVNGLLQSGYSKYVADIPEDALSEDNIQRLLNNGSEATVQGSAMYKVNDGNKAVYDAASGTYKFIVQVYYDPKTNGLVVEDIDTKGGKVYLTGQISSTGNGRILAVDGGAEISITNNTGADLTTGKIINNDIEGRITIIDLAKDTWTEYTRTGANSMSLAAYKKYLALTDAEKAAFATLSDAEKAKMLGYTTEEQKKKAQIQSGEGIGYYDGSNSAGTYSVKDGLRYYWTLGQTKSKTYYYHKVTSSLFWGGKKTKTKVEMEIYEDPSALVGYDEMPNKQLPGGAFVDTLLTDYEGMRFREVEVEEWETVGHSFLKTTEEVDGQTIIKYYMYKLAPFKPFKEELKDSDTGAVLQSGIDYSDRVMTGQWTDNWNWYELWSAPKYHTTWQYTEGSTQSYVFFQKADKNISVGFLGSDNGNGSITVKNTNVEGGSINLNGNIQSAKKDAALTVVAAGGSIIQKYDDSQTTSLTTGRADLQAKNDIKNIHIVSLGELVATTGADGKESYTASDGVRLKAVSANSGSIDVDVKGGLAEGQGLPGNVVIEGLQSSSQTAESSSQTAEVSLRADGNITQTDNAGDKAVTGKTVSLNSTSGAIGNWDADGKPEKPVTVYTAAGSGEAGSNSASVNADAKKHIYLAEKEGDMPVRSIISREGDVRLEVANGRLIDALPQSEQTNNMDEDSVVKHWIDAGLITGNSSYEGAYITGLGNNAADFEQNVREQYDLCDSGEASDRIKEVFMERDAEGGWTFKYDSADEYLTALLNDTSEKGNYYKNTVNAYTNPEYGWTKEQLLYAVRNAVVNKESGVTAETQNKKANVQAKNVTLSAKGVGMYGEEPVIISASDFKGDSDEKVARLKLLHEADATDITLKDGNGNILIFSYADGKQTVKAYKSADLKQEVETNGAVAEIVIGNMSPLGVYATGKLDAAASDGNVFIAGRCNDNEKPAFSPINVGTVSASDGNDVRLYTYEGITNSAASAEETEGGNIRANNLIAYGGTKDIGARDSYLTVNLSGDLLEAAADGNVYIKNVRNNDVLRLGSVYAGDTISLESDKGFGMTETEGYYLAYLNAKKQLELETKGVIGAEANPVRILNNGTVVSLKANNGYVKGMNGMQGDDAVMLLGNIQMNGAFQASSEGNLGVSREEVKDENGQVVSPAITGQVIAGGNVKLEAVKAVTVSGPVKSTAGDITVNAGTDAAVNNSVTAQNGNITIDAVVTAAVNGNITAEDNEKRITVSGRDGVTLDAQVKAGSLALTDGAYTGGGQIGLASENGSIVQTEKGVLIGSTVSAASGKAVTLTNTGNTFRVFNAEGVTYTAADMPEDRDKAIHGNVKVHAHAGNMLTAGIAGSTVVYGDVAFSNLDAGGVAVDTDLVIKAGESGASGSFTLIQDWDILVGGALHVAGSVTETSRKGSVTNEKETEAGQDVKLTTTTGDITADGAIDAGNDVIVTSTSGAVTLKGKTSAKNDIVVTSDSGTIALEDDVKADKGITVTGKGGNITMTGGADAGTDLTVKTNGAGTVTLGAAEKVIHAASNVELESENGQIRVDGTTNTDTGDVKATATAGDITFTKDITATAGNVTVTTSTGAIGLGGNVTATAGNVAVTTTTGAIGLSGVVTAGQGITATTASGAVTLKGKATAKNDITITSDSGTIALEDDVKADKGITVTGKGGNIAMTGGADAGTDLTVKTTGAGAVTLGAAEKVIHAGSNVELETENGQIRVDGKTKADSGNVEAVSQSGSIEFAKDVVAGTDVQLTTVSGDITSDGAVDAGNDVKVETASGKVTLKGKTTAKNDIAVTSESGNIELQDDAKAGKAITVTGKGGNITMTGGADAGTDLTVKTEDEGQIALGVADKEVEIHAGSKVTLGTEKGQIRVDGKTKADSGNVEAVSQSGSIEFAKDVVAGKDVQLTTTTGDITTDGTVDAGNDVNVETASGAVTLKGKTTAANDIVVTNESGNVALQDDAKAGKAITVTGKGGNIAMTGGADAGTDLTVKTEGEGQISLGTADKVIHAGSKVTLGTEKGQIRVDGKTKADSGNVEAASQSGSIEFAKDVMAGTDVQLTTNTGDITTDGAVDAGNDVNVETASGAVTLKGKTTAKNDIAVTSENGNIALEGTTSAGHDVAIKSTTGEIVADGIVDAGNDFSVSSESGAIRLEGNVTAQHDILARNNSGDINLQKTVNAGHDVAVENSSGAILMDGHVDAGNDITAKTDAGLIRMDKDVTAEHDITVTSDSGTIGLLGDIDAGRDVAAATGDTGLLVFSTDWSDGKHEVRAGRNVALTMGHSLTYVGGKVTADTGDVSATTRKGIIVFNGAVEAGRNIEATITEGSKNSRIRYAGDIKAGNDISATAAQGDIIYENNVTAGGSVLAETKQGDVDYNTGIMAEDSVAANVKAGSIAVKEDITAKQGRVSLTAAAGSVTVGENDGTGHIRAGSDIAIATEKGDTTVKTSITSENGSVSVRSEQGNIKVGEVAVANAISAKENIDLYVADGVITVNGKTETASGDITMQARDEDTDRNIVITENGKLVSGRDLTLKTYNGGIEVTDDTLAKRSLTVEVENKGDVTFARNVDVTGNLTAEIKQGNITIGKELKASESIDIGTGSGNVTVGAAVTADKDVKLETETGRIEVSGTTSAVSGDVTLKAANSTYAAGVAGQSIIIEDMGKVEAGRDVTLISSNGDLHVTDEITAGRDVNAITQGKGDVFLDEAMNVNRNMTLQADTGNINLKADANAGGDIKAATAEGNIAALAVNAGNNVDVVNGNGLTKADTVTAKNRISVANGDGSIILGTVDGASVVLTNSGDEGQVTADVIRTEARGNGNGTGAEDLKLGGSYVAAGSVVNKSDGSEPLTISTLGASGDKAVKNFTIGARNAEGNYDGGISSGSGAVMQQLWADNGMVYVNGDTNLHISKLVMNDKLHAANDMVSVAVYGSVPVHDGERVVYWNDSSHVPASSQERWFSRDYSDPNWMYLDLFYNGDIGSRYGVLVDAGGYRQIQGDTRSLTDTMGMMLRMERDPYDIAYFDRIALIQIDDGVLHPNAAEDEIEAE